MAEANGYSADELEKFLQYTESKGLIKEGTARTLRSACAGFFEILGGLEKADLRNLDFEAAFQRFMNLRDRELTPTSLRDYKRRVKTAVKEFLRYKANPAEWRPQIQARAFSAKAEKEKEKPSDQPEKKSIDSRKTGRNMPAVPFPLRERVIVEISGLPFDLTMNEARRLGAFIQTLATDFQPLGTGKQ